MNTVLLKAEDNKINTYQRKLRTMQRKSRIAATYVFSDFRPDWWRENSLFDGICTGSFGKT